jgi:hypothetical protein
MPQRLIVISADCHASPRAGQARDYVDPEFRDAFDAWMADEAGRTRRWAEHTGQAVYGDEALRDFATLDAVHAGGLDGAWGLGTSAGRARGRRCGGRGDLSGRGWRVGAENAIHVPPAGL